MSLLTEIDWMSYLVLFRWLNPVFDSQPTHRTVCVLAPRLPAVLPSIHLMDEMYLRITPRRTATMSCLEVPLYSAGVGLLSVTSLIYENAHHRCITA